jgi:hypothetical protein
MGRKIKKIIVIMLLLPLAIIVNSINEPSFGAAEIQRETIPTGATAASQIDVWDLSGQSEYGTNTVYDVKITLLSVIRGKKALDFIQTENNPHEPLVAGFEYLLARIKIACDVKGDSFLPYKVKQDDFKVYDTAGHAYLSPAVLPPDQSLIDMKINPGDVREGWIPFLVARDHKRPLMFFSGGLWFQLFDH